MSKAFSMAKRAATTLVFFSTTTRTLLIWQRLPSTFIKLAKSNLFKFFNSFFISGYRFSLIHFGTYHLASRSVWFNTNKKPFVIAGLMQFQFAMFPQLLAWM